MFSISLVRFQFHKGTIKTQGCGCTLCAVGGFQFHKGTIKTYKVTAEMIRRAYFNSIKVRLKQRHSQRRGTRRGSFQFHKGTIKTLRRALLLSLPASFQFHKGTIKTFASSPRRPLPDISIP